MAQRTAIRNVLTTCGFTVAAERNFIMGNAGIYRWTAFTLIGYDDLASIAKNASCHNVPFSIGVLKLKCLTALKFWTEDKIRMNENHAPAQFTRAVITTYIKLYAAFVTANDDNVEFVNGPQLNKEDWVGFESGTNECLASLQGSGGVPLSYMLRNDLLRPHITVTSLRETKIFWNAPFLGPDFDADNHRVWAYLAH